MNLGLLRENANMLASAIFLGACVLWLVAYRLLSDKGPVAKWIASGVIGFWILSLAFAFAVGGQAVYKTSFFLVSLIGTTAAVAIAKAVSLSASRRKASSS